MEIHFVKYHGAGNDFIMIDDRARTVEPQLSEEWIAHACHRRFGVGADGMILLQPGQDGADFFMRYYNSDGRVSTFCGNGGRCVVAFAAALGVHGGECRFLGTDGWHEGRVLEQGLVSISMIDVEEVNVVDQDSVVLHTGSPHFVRFADNVEHIDVFQEGRAIRHLPEFMPSGINVNFVERINEGEIKIRTYERGVEDETYACGTGVVAAAIASAFRGDEKVSTWKVHAKGGDLQVDFIRKENGLFQQVWLTGPAVAAFGGVIPV